MFQEGSIYSRIHIRLMYGGQREHGISTPISVPAVFIFTTNNASKYGYTDEWIDANTFMYTGEGDIDEDLKLKRGNKAIMDHVRNEEDIYLFKDLSDGNNIFISKMELVNFYFEDIEDGNNSSKNVVRFILKKVY